MSTRLSVFVDADNIPAAQAGHILALARRHGAPDLVRAYGNACNLPDWERMPGFHFVHSGSGKNATDMLICIDAMERALSGKCEAVMLVSSDQDFTHLATRLRGYGLTVIGAGEAKTVERLRAACSLFEVLPASAPQCPKPDQPGKVDLIDRKIKAVIQKNSKNGHGIPITSLANLMRSEHDFKISELPDKTWRTYLTKRAALYNLDPKGPKANVRFRPEGFANTPV
ncbi:NYN domain-containing protein [Roseovarius autotrophicus]|uniref:NYN domain-containing protein n=1 Tax=Roseovarius autotrophicus TaxID=2824121 RepID=UPI001B38542F|nr:NYN domain-containing protein [Roseovarius autotrophicus]